jgi:hypothetical protein
MARLAGIWRRVVAMRGDLENSAGVSETDPFSDAAFMTRLNKLLSMLGSAQAEEADTARRKLIEYLGQYRLSFTDIGQRLAGSMDRPSFTQGARELSLERQLAIARSAKQEAAAEAQAAAARVHSLEVELQRQTFEIGRLLGIQVRARAWMIVAWVVAAGCLVVGVMPRIVRAPQAGSPQEADHRLGEQVTMQPDPFGPNSQLHLNAGEVPGRAAVQDLAIRLSPNDDANVRAFLNRGEPVVVQQVVHVGPQTWLLIRTTTGSGWVRSGDVER